MCGTNELIRPAGACAVRVGVLNVSSGDSEDSDIWKMSDAAAGTPPVRPALGSSLPRIGARCCQQVRAHGQGRRPAPVCVHTTSKLYCIRYEVDKTHDFCLGGTPQAPAARSSSMSSRRPKGSRPSEASARSKKVRASASRPCSSHGRHLSFRQ